MFPVVSPQNGFTGFLSVFAIRALALVVSINFSLSAGAVLPLLSLALLQATVDVRSRQLANDDWRLFAGVQTLHLSMIAVIWWMLRPLGAGISVELIATSDKAYVLIVAYLGAMFVGGEIVRQVCQAFLAQMESSLASQRPGLRNAGKYIGWLERFLILTFVFSNNGEAIGFLIAAKTLVRFPEIQGDQGHFAEYFLVGTLTSVGLALGVGSIAKLLL